MINPEEGTLIQKEIENQKREVQESIKDVNAIINTAEYSLNELKSVENPRVLVLGTGPFFPEAQIVSKWAEENKKMTIVDCVDREEVPEEYLKIILGFNTSTQYFKMNMINSTFESFQFDKKYNLILLLRFCNLSNIPDSVFRNVEQSLDPNSVFIMSGGLNDMFQGFSLSQGNLSLEKRANIESSTDLYKGYVGENTVIKLRKYTDEI